MITLPALGIGLLAGCSEEDGVPTDGMKKQDGVNFIPLSLGPREQPTELSRNLTEEEKKQFAELRMEVATITDQIRISSKGHRTEEALTKR